MKHKKVQKRILIALGTAIGLVALFFIIVFIPVGDKMKTVEKLDSQEVVKTESAELDTMSRNELEERVKELEAENKELQEEVEKYKILAEETTQAVVAPVPAKNDSKNEETEYIDSSEYYDSDYKNYISDKKETESNKDGKNSTTTKPLSKPSTDKNQSNVKDEDKTDKQPSDKNDSGKFSDTGL